MKNCEKFRIKIDYDCVFYIIVAVYLNSWILKDLENIMHKLMVWWQSTPIFYKYNANTFYSPVPQESTTLPSWQRKHFVRAIGVHFASSCKGEHLFHSCHGWVLRFAFAIGEHYASFIPSKITTLYSWRERPLRYTSARRDHFATQYFTALIANHRSTVHRE